MKEITLYMPQSYGVLVEFDDNDELIEIEKSQIAEAFERYGGSFVQALGVALRRADSNNTERLLRTFQDYVEEYITQFILPSKK